MDSPLRRFSLDRVKTKTLLLACLSLAAFAFSVLPGSASAFSENQYHGTSLASHTWTTGNGVVFRHEFLIAANAETTSSVCVGPVTYNGSFHMPYGWECSPNDVQWVFPEIEAAAGIYNPNPGTFHNFNVVAWGN